MKRAEFFDFGSPASHLAYTQMDGIAQRTGAEIVWRPMLLGGVFKATGNASPAMVATGRVDEPGPRAFREKYGVIQPQSVLSGEYARHDARRRRVRGNAAFLSVCRRHVQGHVGRPENMNDMPTAAAVLKSAGFDPADFMARAESGSRIVSRRRPKKRSRAACSSTFARRRDAFRSGSP